MPSVIISDNTTGTYIGDYSGVEDTEIREYYPTNNYGSGANLEATNYAVGDVNRTLIRFTGLSNLPTSLTVSSAKLAFYLASSTSQTLTLPIYRALLSWVVGGVTWNMYDGSTAWNTAGASGSGTDIASAGSGTFASIPNTPNAYYLSDDVAQFQTDVENFVNGTYTNNGHIVFEDTSSYNYKVFISSDSTDGQRPALLVTYTAGGTPVSNSLTTEYEALAGVAQQSISQFEHLQHAANTAQINFESLASALITSSAVIAYEALQGVPSSKILSIESLAAIAGQVQAQIEAGQRIAKSYTLQLEGKGYVSQTAANRIEVMAYLSASALSQFESLQLVSGNASLNVEALRLIANATGISFEALLGANVTVVINTVTRTAHFAIMLEKTATFGGTLNKTATFGDVIEKTITFH